MTRYAAALAGAVAFAVAALAVRHLDRYDVAADPRAWWLWAAAFVALLGRVTLSWAWNPPPPPAVPDMGIGAVVPFYNESSVSVVHTLRSLRDQTRRPDVVYVIDDGSVDQFAVTEVRSWAVRASDGMDVWVFALPTNAGKRAAQASAWRHAADSVDLWMLVDSDTTVAADGVERMAATFSDETVDAATSLILPRNRGFLPLLQEVEYATNQLGHRALLSWLRTVPVISGGFCAVRAQVVRDNLATYLAGYWGAHISDDRHVALLANARGRVVAQPAARSYTLAPDTWRRYLRQRVRWSRGAWLGQVWTLTRLSAARRIWWVIAGHVAMFAFGLATIVWVVVSGVFTAAPAVYLGYVAVLSWVRSYRYLAIDHPRPTRQFVAWLAAPVQALLAVFVLTPTHIYAAATCRRGAWGTR